ncbi:MAG TPA: hypothetical protein VFP68_16640 [Burkholderiaceae bacterium]|nr:hypothetical protein [Burkholderiaceae bacterium]
MPAQAGIHERNCCLSFAIDRTGDFVPSETRNQLRNTSYAGVTRPSPSSTILE